MKLHRYRLRRRGWAALVILLLLGAAVRVFGAWALRHHVNADAGVVALMARHMAQGRHWPVFFYGQAYMGSFEPAVSALFCRLLGISGFAVGLGTAFLSWLTLPVVYAWAKGARDRAAGLAAVAFCLIGPAGFFHYNVSPRGAYAATLLLGTFCLYMGAKIAARYRATGRFRGGEFVLLGLAAGLGWWSNQLVTAALLATAAVMVVFLHYRLLSRYTLYAALAFVAGSLPFWWFNLVNGWPTLGFRGTLGRLSAGEGLLLFFLERLPGVLGIHTPQRIMRIYPWLLLGVLIAGLVIAVSGWKNRSASRPFLLAVLLFILFSVAIFSVSHFAAFATPRYILPLIPALAVVFGIAVSRLAERFRLAVFLGVLVIIGAQTTVFSWAAGFMRQSEDRAQSYLALDEWAERSRHRYFWGDYDYHGMNFLLEERVTLAVPGRERYIPYAEALESADRVAIVNNYGDVGGFLASQGGSAAVERVEKLLIHYDFTVPRRDLEPIPADQIARAVNARGEDILALFDNLSLETVWRPVAQLEPDRIEVIFESPQTVSMLRLYTPRRTEYPLLWHIEVQDEPGGEWRLLVPPTHFKDYQWSGPRLFAWSDHPRFEVFFDPVEVSGLRLHNAPYRPDWQLTPRFARIFGPGRELPEESAMLGRLVERLDDLGLNRIYADRYVAHRVKNISGGRIEAPVESYVQNYWDIEHEPLVRIGRDLAFVIRKEDAPFCREVLETMVLEAEEVHLPPWVIFHFPGRQFPDGVEFDYPLSWTGFTPALMGRWLKSHSAWEAAGTHRQVGTNLVDEEGRSFRVAYPGSGPGIMSFGNYLALAPGGRYRAWFELRSGDGGSSIRLDVAADQGREILAETEIQLPPGEDRTYVLEFETPPRVVSSEPRVHYGGDGKVMVGRIGLERLSR